MAGGPGTQGGRLTVRAGRAALAFRKGWVGTRYWWARDLVANSFEFLKVKKVLIEDSSESSRHWQQENGRNVLDDSNPQIHRSCGIDDKILDEHNPHPHPTR